MNAVFAELLKDVRRRALAVVVSAQHKEIACGPNGTSAAWRTQGRSGKASAGYELIEWEWNHGTHVEALGALFNNGIHELYSPK